MKQKIILTFSFIFLLSFSFVYAIEGNTWVGESEITMFKGWNLVMGFIHPNQLEEQELAGSHIKAVFAFLPEKQIYARVYPNPEEDKLSSITEEELYQTSLWVYSDKTSKTEFWVDEELLPLVNRSFLHKGYNFIGVTSDMLGVSGKPAFKDLIGDCNIEKAYFFNPEEQNWVAFPMDEELSREALGLGMVLKVSEDCNMGTSGNSFISPPQLPGDCVDTDGGKNYYQRGVASTSFDSVGESCVGITNWDIGYKVIESFCNEKGEVEQKEFECPNMCRDGACVSEVKELRCTDSDGTSPTDQNYNVKGTTNIYFGDELLGGESDECNGNAVIEKYCSDTSYSIVGVEQPCPNGCSNGACI
tara:strand:- start:245 stop:1324 length:1080 start_codon:yes stop_codon:yes gene_type:complete